MAFAFGPHCGDMDVVEIQPGKTVLVRDAWGATLTKRAVTGVTAGRDFAVVWACRQEEWEAAEREGREPEALPWPAEDVSTA